MPSRRNPSASKVRYLLHLSEGHNWVAKACRRNAATISEYFDPVLSPNQNASNSANDMEDFVVDFEYLAKELDQQTERIQKLKALIIEQADSMDKRRNKTLGVLIAIYFFLSICNRELSHTFDSACINQKQSFFGIKIDAGQVRTRFRINTTTITPRPQHKATCASFDTQAFQESSSTFANRAFFVVNDASRLTKYDLPLDLFDRYVHRLTGLDIGTLPDLQTAAHVTDSQPVDVAWSMKTFGIVAGSLTFGSIIGPMVKGRSYVML
jgi:hypothetical protein